MFSSVNAENKSKAKNVLTNAVVGLLLALSAWLLVDFMMKTLYNPATQDQSGKVWGPWNSILGDGTRPDGTPSYCLVTHTPPAASTEPTVLSEAEVRAQVEATVSAMLRSCVSTLTDAQNTCLLSARNETNVRTCVPGITATQLTCITNGIMSIASGGTGVTTGTPSSPTAFAVGSRVECSPGNDANTYEPGVVTVVNASAEPPTVTVRFDTGGLTGTVRISRCRAPSGTTGTGIPANGSVTQVGGSCANNTRACAANLRCGTTADGDNKDRCIAVTTPPTTTGTEAQVRARLSAANISVNNPNACPAGETYQAYRARTGNRCTTVGGLTSATINHAIGMSSKWGGFQITGGSEAGHATHGGGNRFDAIGGIGSHLSALPAATAAQIQSSGIRAGTTGVHADSCGNTYFNEGDHWHITVFTVCSNLPS